MSAKQRIARTTVLTVNPAEIDWPKLSQNCHLVCYKMPYKKPKDYLYYPRMHNWYKEACEHPCYLHTYGQSLYVKYPAPQVVSILEYEQKPLDYAPVDLQNEDNRHSLVKTLASDYFYKHEAFVSNVDFFLRVSAAEDDFITGLKIRIRQDWHNPNEFYFIDEATRLRRLRPEDIERVQNWWGKNYYGLFYSGESTIFKQLKPSQITAEQKRAGIYVIHRNSNTRAKVVYHSIKNLEAHQASRTAILNKFFRNLLGYFGGIGLPFQNKQLQMYSVETIRGTRMNDPQLSFGNKPVSIVDDRIRSRLQAPDEFTAQFCAVANEAFEESGVAFIVKSEADLTADDHVLRIQDYAADDFKDKTKKDWDTETDVVTEKALLGAWDDPYLIFNRAHAQIVRQSLNINPNTHRKREKSRSKNGQSPSWTIESYLGYDVPDPEDVKLRLEVCLAQLVLKDAVIHPQNIQDRLPQVEAMADKVFMYNQCLVYYDGADLNFMRVQNNYEAASTLIRQVTGKDLITDVLMPSVKKHTFNPSATDLADTKKIAGALKRRFIISRDYIWEINDSDGRVLYEDQIIGSRFRALEDERPGKFFYPKFPSRGDEPFSEAQLRQYETFLAEKVKEAFISYNTLKRRYGKHIRNDRGEILEEGKGFYAIFGITNDRKFKRYLNQSHGLAFESLKDKTVIPIYQGIWYEPETRQYLVGSKNSYQNEQDKGFVLREIVSYDGDNDADSLFNTLKRDFFPMLEVNFVRHRDYTVYPFPFKLIDVWNEMQRWLADEPA